VSESRAIDFYFDYISPNAYIAWTQIRELARRHGRQVTPHPVLFAGLLQAHGLLGPAEVPAKWRWMLRDIVRKCRRLDLPLRPPASHPFNPLLALRVSSLPMDPAARERLIDRLFHAVWAEAADVSEPATVAAAATAAGLDGDAVVESAARPETKAALRRRTDEAVERGAFGVPTMIAGGELFWGYDDFDHLEARLAGRDPLDAEDLAPWLAIRPTATRRRPRPGGSIRARTP
jgi:2-hydroxychromene-2-carboxylate isomerase